VPYSAASESGAAIRKELPAPQRFGAVLKKNTAMDLICIATIESAGQEDKQEHMELDDIPQAHPLLFSRVL